MSTKALLVKAFSSDPDYGNPAGVVLDASLLSDEHMQDIARDLGYSETAFVLPSTIADFRVRFFTPTQELDYCGHATVATFSVLFEQSEERTETSLTQETRAGTFTIEKSSNGMIMMTQKSAMFGTIEKTNETICSMLGITASDFDPDLPIQIVKNNAAELLIPMRSIDVLKDLQPDLSAIKQFVVGKPYHGVYCFVRSPTENNELYARSFAPAVGIDEDPATGVAAGPLACYADKYLYGGQTKDIIIHQGMWMGKACELFVDLHDGVKVGGYAVEFGTREYMA